MAVIVPLLLLLLCASGTLLLLRAYLPLRSTPQHILVPVFLAILLPCSIVLLVPIDLASNSGEGDRGIVLSDRVLLVAWRIAYWLTFCLTWAILPILQSYSDSGHRSTRARLIQAFHENARYQAIMLTLGGLGLIYVFITSGVHFSSLVALVIALSHCYALTLAIFLMGHGLVAIPKGLFRSASTANNLRRLQLAAPKIHDNLADATNDLGEIQAEVAILKSRKHGTAKDFQDWIDELSESVGVPDQAAQAEAASRGRSAVPQVITEEYLAGLSRRAKFAKHKQARWRAEWEAIVQEAAEEQAILDSAASKRLIFPTPFTTSRFKNFFLLNAYTRHVLYLYIVPWIKRGLGVILALASACIIWSEIVHLAFRKLSIVGYTVVHHPKSDRGSIGLAGQVIASLWIAYMCACAFTSMRTVKVWGGHALVPRKTRLASACFYASYACRMTVPLSYNFGGFLYPEVVFKKSTFYQFLGNKINLTPLGSGFNNIFPILVLLPVAASLFNFYSKMKEYVGLGDFVADDEEEESLFGAGGWREGRDLIERELGGGVYGALSTSGPIRGAGAARGSTRTVGSASTRGGAGSERTRIPSSRDDEEDDAAASGFGDFFHRVRNTIETPVWLRSQEERPRWMQGNRARAGPGLPGPASRRSGDDSDSDDGIGNWFSNLFGGGGGRVRL